MGCCDWWVTQAAIAKLSTQGLQAVAEGQEMPPLPANRANLNVIDELVELISWKRGGPIRTDLVLMTFT